MKIWQAHGKSLQSMGNLDDDIDKKGWVMKKQILMYLIFVSSFSFGSDKTSNNKVGPTRGLPAELSDAMHDFANVSENRAAQEKILWRINTALLGGGQLEQTKYSLDDITKKIPRETLWNMAMKKHLWGILSILGYQHRVQLLPENKQNNGQK